MKKVLFLTLLLTQITHAANPVALEEEQKSFLNNLLNKRYADINPQILDAIPQYYHESIKQAVSQNGQLYNAYKPILLSTIHTIQQSQPEDIEGRLSAWAAYEAFLTYHSKVTVAGIIDKKKDPILYAALKIDLKDAPKSFPEQLKSSKSLAVSILADLMQTIETTYNQQKNMHLPLISEPILDTILSKSIHQSIEDHLIARKPYQKSSDLSPIDFTSDRMDALFEVYMNAFEKELAACASTHPTNHPNDLSEEFNLITALLSYL